MKITFLGTGTSQGVPVIGCSCAVCQSLDYRNKRFRSSILVEYGDYTLVVDTGPDFRQQMLSNRVQKLDAVLYTHEHKDHTAGLDDVRPFNFKQKRDMPLYGEDRVLTALEESFSYAFAKVKYPGVPNLTLHHIGNEPFSLSGHTIIPIRAMHHKLPVLGFRFGNFTYLTDANHIDPEERDKIRGSKVFVLNALQIQPHISHYTLEQAINVAEDIQAETTYFTHISHQLGLHDHVDKRLPDSIHLAYDGLTLTL